MGTNDVWQFLYNIIDYVLAGIGGVMTWLYHSINKKFDEQASDLRQVKKDHFELKDIVLREYTPKKEFTDCMNRIDDKLDDLKRILMQRAP